MKACLFMVLSFVVFLTFSTTASMAELKDGLVAYWPMDDGSGDIALDATGNGHDGTLHNGTLWEMADARNGDAAVNLDGEDDVIEIEPFDVIGGGITLAAWVRPDDFGTSDARIISKATEWGTNDHWWMLSTIDGNHVLRFRLKTNDGQDTALLIATSGGLEAGKWQHVAATWDGSDMRLYQDGEEVDSMAKGGTAVATDDNVSVGIGSQPLNAFNADPNHAKLPFDGLIDDVLVYNRALNEDEIKQLASGVSPNLAVEPAGKLTTTWAYLKQLH